MSKIKIKELKLGPTAPPYTDTTANSTVMNFTGGQPQIVIVTYRDILEDWTLNVFETDAVKITSADGWVNVAWLYGEGLESEDNGFEIREATSEEWQKVECFLYDNDRWQFLGPYSSPESIDRLCLSCIFGNFHKYGKDLHHYSGNRIAQCFFRLLEHGCKVANPWEENSTPFWDTGNIALPQPVRAIPPHR